jgi:hypothetical protein
MWIFMERQLQMALALCQYYFSILSIPSFSIISVFSSQNLIWDPLGLQAVSGYFNKYSIMFNKHQYEILNESDFCAVSRAFG